MKISEVSKKYDIPVDTLRYYEKEGLLPSVKKNESGIRNYTEEDCNWIEFIKCMRGAGLSIEVLKRYIDLFYEGDSTLEERKQILIDERKRLLEKRDLLQSTINRLEVKIEYYDKTLCDKNLKIKRR